MTGYRNDRFYIEIKKFHLESDEGSGYSSVENFITSVVVGLASYLSGAPESERETALADKEDVFEFRPCKNPRHITMSYRGCQTIELDLVETAKEIKKDMMKNIIVFAKHGSGKNIDLNQYRIEKEALFAMAESLNVMVFMAEEGVLEHHPF